MKYLFLSYLFAITAVTCNNENNNVAANDNYTSAVTDTSTQTTNITDSTKDAVQNETLAGKWFLQPALPSDTASGRIPILDFDLSTKRFNGNSGCNGMSGSFTLNGDVLTFSERIISTKMACPGYNEKAFLDNLLKTNRYQIQNGVLQLMYNTTVLSKWARTKDTSVIKQL